MNDPASAAYRAHRLGWDASRRMQSLEQRKKTVKALLEDRRASFSWRMTVPLRLANDAIQWGITRSRRIGKVCAKSGGQTSKDVCAWMRDYQIERQGPLVIDVSRVYSSDIGTGIQRVVRRIAESVVALGLPALPADLRNGGVHDLSDWFSSGQATERMPAEIHGLGKLLMLDGSWDIHRNIGPLLRRCNERNVEVITTVYDLIPIDHPETCKDDLPDEFLLWLHQAMEFSDAFVCISEATARRLAAYIESRRDLPCRATRIGWWPLGTDFSELAVATCPECIVPPSPYCLAVGTLEPRKNHRFLIETFSRWWREEDFQGHLAIAGRLGWQTGELVEIITSHPEFGRRLWWFPEISDEHLRDLYAHSAAVLMPSLAEGFGLPVAEGARFLKPVVLSDIPVFREVVVKNGYFFTLGDEDSFRSSVLEALKRDAAPTQVNSIRWQDSARALVELIAGNKYQISLA